MNSKLVKAGLAGAAVIALAAGGGTFAAWSDFQTTPAAAGAGFLKLDIISDHQGTDTNAVQPFSLAPGQHKTQNFYLASADSGNTPVGDLTAYVANLTDTEDTASGTCTTNSEAAAESTSNCAANGGELSSEAIMNVWKLSGVTTAAQCDHYDGAPLVNNQILANVPNTAASAINLGDVAAGQGVCMVVEVSLPSTADDKVQGDDMTWNWHFDLTQV